MTKPVYEKKCPYCGFIFTKDFSHQKFCSLHCAFFSRIKMLSKDECWPWVGSCHKFGYGEFRHKNNFFRSHRVSVSIFHGVDYDLIINANHICDNPNCVNPNHLYSGNQQQNLVDAAKRKRTGGIKLSVSDVQEIKNLLSKKETHKSIASKYNVCEAAISHISSNRNWSHVTSSAWSE